MKETFYITTTLPYVNAKPHMGHALEFVQADIIARYKFIKGHNVFFNTGTDEHGIKVFRKALEGEKDPQEYVDEYAEKFRSLLVALNVYPTRFIRTTDPEHKKAAQEFWKRCADAGDIYKKNYKVKYCVGCELEKTDSELEDGKCPVHPNLSIEMIEEENYFFRFSQYGPKLLELYENDPSFVLPNGRLNEIRQFVSRGLEDFSISRLKEKMPWGVAVPNDPDHVMYVWFDALVNYISTIGWPDNEKFDAWWPVVQIAGKDNLRQQAAMWQAMLFSAGIEPSKQILIHGFITSEGQKMSKSLGNAVDPVDLIDRFGTDALRYYLAREIPTFEDGDFTVQRFIETYNANLANGIGNLVSRVLAMSMRYFDGAVRCNDAVSVLTSDEKDLRTYIREDIMPQYEAHMEKFEIGHAADVIWELIGELDRYVTYHEPFKLIKTDKERTQQVLWELLFGIREISVMLSPFLSETSEKIATALGESGDPMRPEFSAQPLPEPLFLRVEEE